MKLTRIATVALCALSVSTSQSHGDDAKIVTLPDTKPLTIQKPLDEVMVEGINRFAERELKKSVKRRRGMWHRDYSSPAAYEKSIAENRYRLRQYLGLVDSRVKRPRFELLQIVQPRFELLRTLTQGFAGTRETTTSVLAFVSYVRWRVSPSVTAEGLLIQPSKAKAQAKARIIAIPDADWTPEQFCGLDTSDKSVPARLVQELSRQECEIIIPTLINRDDKHSGHPAVTYTNQPHREFVYRMGFEMGRHIVGYEVQKVLAAVDAFEHLNEKGKRDLPIGVVGVGEGGMLALFSAAIDSRIDSAMVCGYFQKRENVWQEPIYRNIWGQLTEFGDAELAGLIAPRNLVIEACAVPNVDGPPKVKPRRRGGAAPGMIVTAPLQSVKDEMKRAATHFEKLKVDRNLTLAVSGKGKGPAGTNEARTAFLNGLSIKPSPKKILGDMIPSKPDADADLFNPAKRHERQFRELVRHVQDLLRESAKVRDSYWADAKRTSLKDWMRTSRKYRKAVWEDMIGRLPDPTMPPNVRTRKVIDESTHVGYEVVIDVYPDVIAAGILLLPKGMKQDEKRPVVVCQHGLEGTPMDTITTDKSKRAWRAYKGFSTALVKRGFIVYAPQNPYKGRDRFRVIQRKSNPLKRSLFSYIIPQHQRTLNWLATLPNVDATRIAFYGLSYGGKTAVRVPPILVPPQYRDPKANDAPKSPGYCLSICSADFNEWVKKNTSNEDRYSYIFTGEYEIFEWNMGHTANYAELSYLMTPRPFMVERGHDDGVAPDEWVAWEYAKVRRHYVKLGIGDRTEIEFFDGPHTINGQGTFEFLHKHLNWPKPQSKR